MIVRSDIKAIRRPNNGFSLFEVVAAITILTIGISAILAGFNEMNTSHALSIKRGEALAIARELVAQVRSQNFTPGMEEKEGEIEGSVYRFNLTFAETEWDNLYSVNIRIDWGNEDNPGFITVYTLQYYD
jgi:prepilin-type N-terminal cleavage/methylation domain-containing protein